MGKILGTIEELNARRLAVDNDGRIWLSGTSWKPFDYEGTAVSSRLTLEGYLLQLDPTGELVLQLRPAPQNWRASAIASIVVDDEDNLVVLGNGAREDGASATFLRKLSPEGELLFGKELSSSYQLSVQALAVDGLMRTFVAGTFAGTFESGGEIFESSADGRRLWLAQYSRDGELLWQKTYSSNQTAIPTGATTDAFGNIILLGSGTDLTFENEVLKPSHIATSTLSFVLKLRPNGNGIWATSIEGNTALRGVAATRAGGIWAGGSFRGPIWFEDRELISDAANSALLLRLDP
jgi:hypothetical protein